MVQKHSMGERMQDYPTLLSTLSSSPHVFLQPPPTLHADALALAKAYLDPIAAATSKAQEERLRAIRRKRKRGDTESIDPRSILRLKELHVSGFNLGQIWEQARRALDATRREVEKSLEEVLPLSEREKHHEAEPHTNGTSRIKKNNAVTTGRSVDSSSEAGSEDEDGADAAQAIVLENSSEDASGLEEEADDESQTQSVEDIENVDENEEYDMDTDPDMDPDMNLDSDTEDTPDDVYVADKNGLNDGFFSIDNFNRQSEFLEQQDARGEDDGAASDEEDIDWGVDPSTLPVPVADFEDDEVDDAKDSSDDELGPVFGDAKLDEADLADSEVGSEDGLLLDDMNAINNTNDIKYADFFAPPARKLTKSTRRRALPKTQPPSQLVPEEEDIQRTISAVKRDIFEDDITPPASDSLEPSAGGQSSHQKRQAALTAEIRRLEAAALAKRDWQLSGEARASDRPINSLLEEDLDFERVGKPVPVITQEVTEDIESLIKRRILAREFDEVIRRRPGSTTNLPSSSSSQQQAPRRGLADDLASTDKPRESLSALYETEHLRRTDPSSHPDPIDAATQAAHAEITKLWKEVSAQLDALTSWHFRPKPPDLSVNVVADVPRIQIEDARPAGVEGAEASMLAPQEIYKPGDLDDRGGGGARKEVVRTKGGLPIAREEMTREERRRRRRRLKERLRKAEGGAGAGGAGGGSGKGDAGAGAGAGAATGGDKGKKNKKKENEGVLRELKKSGVKVIGRKGEVRDVEGKRSALAGARGGGAGNKNGAAAFKL